MYKKKSKKRIKMRKCFIIKYTLNIKKYLKKNT